MINIFYHHQLLDDHHLSLASMGSVVVCTQHVYNIHINVHLHHNLLHIRVYSYTPVHNVVNTYSIPLHTGMCSQFYKVLTMYPVYPYTGYIPTFNCSNDSLSCEPVLGVHCNAFIPLFKIVLS